MSPFLYQKVFTGAMMALSTVIALPRLASDNYKHQEQGSSLILPVLLCAWFVLWIGLRPVSSAFGDTTNYALEYARLDPYSVHVNWSSEWVWELLKNGCKAAGLSIHAFFTIIAAGYVMSALCAVKSLMPDDPMLGTVFVLASLMFFPFATNGLRNGLACHLFLLAMAFMLKDKWLPGILVSLMAFGIHRSVMLPIVALVTALFLSRNVKKFIVFWLASILISLIAGGTFESFFASLGFDDRMTQYTTLVSNEFSHEGFRWDFLLYSSLPVLMAWYVCIKQQASDNWYDVICTVYLLCNAFWIMVIRSAFSNRFAYLSWFLYPIVIAYPLVNLVIRYDQDRFTGLVLLAYSAFSMFMWFVFW